MLDIIVDGKVIVEIKSVDVLIVVFNGRSTRQSFAKELTFLHPPFRVDNFPVYY